MIIKFTQTNGFGEEVHKGITALAGFTSVADGELTTAQIVCALAELLSEDEDMLMDNLIPKSCSAQTVGYADFRRTGARVIAPRGCTMRRRAIDRKLPRSV